MHLLSPNSASLKKKKLMTDGGSTMLTPVVIFPLCRHLYPKEEKGTGTSKYLVCVYISFYPTLGEENHWRILLGHLLSQKQLCLSSFCDRCVFLTILCLCCGCVLSSPAL